MTLQCYELYILLKFHLNGFFLVPINEMWLIWMQIVFPNYGQVEELFRCTTVISCSVVWILWHETQDEVRVYQRSEEIRCSNTASVETALYRGIWTGVWHRVFWPWTTLNFIFLLWNRDEVVYVKALFVNSEVWSLWKPLLLFAKSECSSLFMVHKPGWLLEPFVWVVGWWGSFGEVQPPGLVPDSLTQSFCEWT